MPAWNHAGAHIYPHGVALGSRRLPLVIAAAALVAVVALAAAVFEWSGATLAGDPVALARIDLQPFAGRLESATATGPDGRPLPLVLVHGRLTPRVPLEPGARVTVQVVVRRPGWLAWALGKTRSERLQISAPVAQVSDRWPTVRAGGPLRLHFDHPVVAYAAGTTRNQLQEPTESVELPAPAPAGTIQVAAAARSWERLPPPVKVSWFPAARSPVALTAPDPGSNLAPTDSIRLTLSKPVDDVFGSATPRLTPRIAGRWRRADSHTLVFTPSGYGAPFASHVHLDLPHPVAVAGSAGRAPRVTGQLSWFVPPGSTMRLQQLLAQAGYLPVDWTPDGSDVARTARAQVRAAVAPPSGSFNWRYPNAPPELRGLWKPGQPNQVTRGAVMMFQDTHHLTVDSFAGPQVWHALIADAIAGRRRDAGYSYVYVHSRLPQSLTLWHNGHTVLRSPGNTGVPAAPTQLGTFQVFEHIPVGTMSGTNPDGSHYKDPGIRWISYFNGGDAIHAFNRASFGTPQSLGCVELPLASAAKVWPYTPIGTLVTIES
jgi:hypothetical protein